MEFMFNQTYFLLYYSLFIVELWNISNIQFIQIIIGHLFSEIIQSTIRFSKYYFNKTQEYYNKLLKYNESKNMSILNFILNIIEDDCTFMEWKIRHSIDIAIRYVKFFLMCYLQIHMKEID